MRCSLRLSSGKGKTVDFKLIAVPEDVQCPPADAAPSPLLERWSRSGPVVAP